MNRLRFLLHYLSFYKTHYLLGVIFIALTNWIAVSIPQYIQLSIDLISQGIPDLKANQGILLRYLLIMFLMALSIIVVRTLSRIFFFNPGRAIEFRIKNDLFRKLTFLQKDYYDHNPTGNIISRIQNDVTGVRLICGFGIMQIFNILTALSFAPYKMWQLSPTLTLYCVLPIIITFIIVRAGMHYMVKHTRRRMDRLQQLSGFIVSSLSGIDVIKGFALNDWAAKQFSKHNLEVQNEALRISFFRSFLMPVLTNLENLLKVLTLLVGGVYVIQGGFTIGELTAFLAYVSLLTIPIMGLGWVTTLFQQGMVGLASLETILSKKTPGAGLIHLPKEELTGLFEKGLKVQDIQFSYPGQSQPVLSGISFDILPNQTVGIFGKIGTGKTTLVNCLNRYLRVDQGKILLGGKDIDGLNYQDIHAVIRTVSQDAFLFSDSVEENIRFGEFQDLSIENKGLDQIIFDSALTDEVNRFPDGVKSMVGEKGIMVSGGQKQRISLARAMMAPCSLLILDDVLSAVDYETESFLLGRVLQRKTARSLLIVSQRLRALEGADLILVLDQGRVVDRGTHKELIQRPGIYRDIWILQNGINKE